MACSTLWKTIYIYFQCSPAVQEFGWEAEKPQQTRPNMKVSTCRTHIGPSGTLLGFTVPCSIKRNTRVLDIHEDSL